MLSVRLNRKGRIMTLRVRVALEDGDGDGFTGIVGVREWEGQMIRFTSVLDQSR